MKRLRFILFLLAFGVFLGARAWTQVVQHAVLSPSEVEKLRDAQDPGARIKVYLDLMQTRLSRFQDFRERPVNPEYRMGKFLDEVLRQYVELDDELKSWIQYQYNRQGDMRSGLHVLLDTGTRQLGELHHIQQNPDPYVSRYSGTLSQAIADMEDTLDGGSRALAGQVKQMGELKQAEKTSARASKQDVKAEKKRLKQERKLAKKEQKLWKKEQKQQKNSDE